MEIISVINGLEDLDKLSGVTEEEIIEAESKLGLKFAKEYKVFLKEFGAIMAEGIELKGINVSKALNLVENTLELRKYRKELPNDLYVVSSVGMDDIDILQNEEGEIFECSPKEIKKIYNTLCEYIKSI